MKNNEKKLEEELFEVTNLKESKDKHLLNLEIFVGILSVIILFICIFFASYIDINNIYRILLIVFGFLIFLISIFWLLKIEQVAGYYECRKCNHKYVPTYLSVLLAMHIFRTRYMKCPKCNKYSWNKKILSDK